MERKVRYSKITLAQLDVIATYLFEYWGENVADDFILKFKITVKQLAKNPELGTLTEAKRYSFPLKMYRLHYTFGSGFLNIAFIQDMRSNKEMINIK